MTIEDFCAYCGTTLAKAEDRLKGLGEGKQYFATKERKGQGRDQLYYTILSFILPQPRHILEIGTGDGSTTILLCKLWKNSKVFTCDLPDNHFMASIQAERKKGKPEIATFNQAIRMPNVSYISKDSFFLPDMRLPGSFDLIYVDGNHHYPACAWDIAWAYGNLNPGGFMFMDDFGGECFVHNVVWYMEKIIPEKVELLPWAGYNRRKKIAWLRKS